MTALQIVDGNQQGRRRYDSAVRSIIDALDIRCQALFDRILRLFANCVLGILQGPDDTGARALVQAKGKCCDLS